MAPLSPAHRALGLAIRSLRQELAVPLSQEGLAAEAGLHRTYIGGVERGERNISYANLRRVAETLGVAGSQLLARAEQLERRR